MNNRYMSNNIERNATWRVGVYCRLSKDDELTGESASISNQRDILVNYCQSQGWQVVDVFQDDGYTGLNTDRPDLQRLLKACEKGLVNLVITKDQSRLGRNQTGKQEHEPERFTVYHGTFKHQYHNELVRSCVHRYRKIRGSASNRIRSIYHDFNHA